MGEQGNHPTADVKESAAVGEQGNHPAADFNDSAAVGEQSNHPTADVNESAAVGEQGNHPAADVKESAAGGSAAGGEPAAGVTPDARLDSFLEPAASTARKTPCPEVPVKAESVEKVTHAGRDTRAQGDAPAPACAAMPVKAEPVRVKAEPVNHGSIGVRSTSLYI